MVCSPSKSTVVVTDSGAAALQWCLEAGGAPVDVVLLDDDDHTYDYVVEMLVKLFFKTVEEAYRHAVEVDSTGRTVVMTCDVGALGYVSGRTICDFNGIVSPGVPLMK